MINWRTAYAQENRAILEWGNKTYREKTTHTVGIGAIWFCAVVFAAAVFCGMTVSGETWNPGGLIFGCIAVLVIIFICGMMILGSHKKLKMLEQGKYSISEAQVIDKRSHTGRAYGENGKFLKVRLQDGKEEEYLIGTYTYELVSLETKLIVIKYNDDGYGFYDQYDFVPVKE